MFPKYFSIFKTQLANRLAYPLDLAAQSVTIVLFMWIFGQLWRVTYSAIGQTSINGLTMNQTLWYMMIAEVIVLSRPRLSKLISDSVKDGSIAYVLNKPYNLLLYHTSIGLANAISSAVFNILAGSVMVWLLMGPPPDPRGWPLVIVSILLGFLIDTCISMLIGLASFVTEDVSAFDWIYSKFLLLLGGTLIPLDFFPGWLRSITQALPFAYTVYGPARLFVEPEPGKFLILLAGQLAWLGVFAAVVAFAYRKSMGWLAINGG